MAPESRRRIPIVPVSSDHKKRHYNLQLAGSTGEYLYLSTRLHSAVTATASTGKRSRRPGIGQRVVFMSSDADDACFSTGIFLGTIMLFFGYRFYKPCVFFGGFILGAVITYTYCVSTSHVTAYGAGLCAGVIFGTLAIMFYSLGVFFLGALWGITLALILNALFLSRISFVICQVSICLYFSSVPVQMRIVLMWVSPHVRQCNTLLWLAIAIFGTLFGLLSLTGGNDTTS